MIESMRGISKDLAARDRSSKTALIELRRVVGLKQEEIDLALGWPRGWTHDIEAYDSDPTMSDMRRYEAIIMFAVTEPDGYDELMAIIRGERKW